MMYGIRLVVNEDMIENLMYIWEVLCQIWPIGLIIGFISIPLIWIWLEESSEYELLDDYYITSAKEQIEKYNSKYYTIDESKHDLDK